VKIIVLLLSGAVRLLFGLVPILIVKLISPSWSQSQTMSRIISLLMFFGGGVLLATCFLHLMPEVRESFSTALPHIEFPIAEIVFIVGFFLVYLLEDIVHSVLHRRRAHKNNKKKELSGASSTSLCSSGTTVLNAHLHTKQDSHNGSLNTDCIVPLPSALSPATTNTMSIGQQQSACVHNNNNGGQSICVDNSIPTVTTTKNELSIPQQLQNNIKTSGSSNRTDLDWWRDTIQSQNSRLNLLSKSCTCVPDLAPDNLNSESKIRAADQNTDNASNSSSEDNTMTTTHGHSHIPCETEDSSFSGELRNILIIVAISFHGVFEGMAIGLQKTEKDVWYLFLAVSLHECTILFCIGVELISSKTKLARMIVYILVVSLVCPLGITIGTVVTEHSFGQGNAHVLTVGLFQVNHLISLSIHFFVSLLFCMHSC